MKFRFRTLARIVAVVALAALPATMVAVPAHAEDPYSGELTVEFSPEAGPSVAVVPGTVDPKTLVATVKSTIEGASFELGDCQVSVPVELVAPVPVPVVSVVSGPFSLSDCAGTYTDVTFGADPATGTTDVTVSAAAGAFSFRWPELECSVVISWPPRITIRCRLVW